MDINIKDIIKNDGKLTEGVYTITGVSGLLVTLVPSGSGYVFELREENYKSAQDFKLESLGGDVWRIVPVDAEKYCFDIAGCSDKDGAKLICYQKNNTNAQKFKIEKDGDAFRIKTGASSYKKYIKSAGTLSQTSAKDDSTLWSFHMI